MTVTSMDRAEAAERYFVDVVRRVFDDYFGQLGARHSQSSSRNIVRYDSDSWFAEVIYLPEDGPNYSPRVLIGCREEPYEDPRRNRTDVMHTVPEGNEERSYNLRWKYRNRHQLEVTLKSVRDRIIEVYAKRYLADSKKLRSLLKERCKVIETEWAEEIDGHNAAVFREKAENAFKLKNYVNAVCFYEQIPRDRLTGTDRARMRYARTHASQD